MSRCYTTVASVIIMLGMVLAAMVLTRYSVTRDYHAAPGSSPTEGDRPTNKCNPSPTTLYTPFKPDQCLPSSRDTWSSAGNRWNDEGCMCLERCIDGECRCPYNGMDIDADGFYGIMASIDPSRAQTACRRWPETYDDINVIIITEYIIALVYGAILIKGLVHVRRLWLYPEQRHIEREVIAICAVFVGVLAMNDWLFEPLSSPDRTNTNIIIPRVVRQMLTELTLFVTIIFGRRICGSWRMDPCVPIIGAIIRVATMIAFAFQSTNMLMMYWLVNLGFDFLWCIWSLLMMTRMHAQGGGNNKERECLQFVITPCLIMVIIWILLQVMQPVTIKIAHAYHMVECTFEAAWWAMLFKLFWNVPMITTIMDARRPIDIIGAIPMANAIPVPVAAPDNNDNNKAVAAVADDDNTTAAANGAAVELEGYDSTRGEGQVAYAYATPVPQQQQDQQPGLQVASSSYAPRGMVHQHAPRVVGGIPATVSAYALLVAPGGGYAPLPHRYR